MARARSTGAASRSTMVKSKDRATSSVNTFAVLLLLGVGDDCKPTPTKSVRVRLHHSTFARNEVGFECFCREISE